MEYVKKHPYWILSLLTFLILGCPRFTSGADISDHTQVQWYGYFKLDLAYDRARSSHGNFIMYVRPHQQNNPTSTINMTARQTRLGLNIHKGRASGKFEVDFYGGGPENKNLLMLRKAYVDVPIGPASLRAGQAADLISPLVPSTINYTVGWGAGNIGYRRPQIQVSGRVDNIFIGLALARNISSDLNGDAVLDGEASCVPALQARLAYHLTPAGKEIVLGYSAHYGLMDSPGAVKEDYNTWSINGDLKFRLTPRLTLLGEYYTGANTGAYFGAILNGDCVLDLRSRGGWANVQYQLTNQFTLSVGGGLDDLLNEPETSLANGLDVRCKNAFCFGNLTYQIHPGVTTGLEVSGWQTEYLNPSQENDQKPTDIRIQWSLQSKF